jgi:hypothetical protein
MVKRTKSMNPPKQESMILLSTMSEAKMRIILHVLKIGVKDDFFSMDGAIDCWER